MRMRTTGIGMLFAGLLISAAASAGPVGSQPTATTTKATTKATTAKATKPGHPPGLGPILARAQKGNVKDALVLGELYQYGFGLPDHNVPALAWYLVAAHAGNATAASRAQALAHVMPAAEVAKAHAQAAQWTQPRPVARHESPVTPLRGSAARP